MTILKNSAILLVGGSVLVACAAVSAPFSTQMISLGSHRLEIHLEGSGTPTVVIDAGLADQLERLAGLQERIARVTRVVTYNRAGYGRSEPGPLPRDCGREADELRVLLEKASVPGPYVLVGHSLGCLNVQVLASRYPGLVAGMVLLDPPPLSFILGQDFGELRILAERMTKEWQSVADAAAKSPDAEGRVQSAFFGAIASEHREMFGETARLVGAISTFGDMPLVVLAAGKPNSAFGDRAEEYQKYWIEQSRALTEKSTNSKFILADESSHHLYVDVPELVAEAVLGVVYEARAH